MKKFQYDCRRDYDIDRLLREMEERGEPLPESRPADAVVEGQPKG
jgi:hypothetical protein